MPRSLNDLRDDAMRIATEHGFTDASVPEDLCLIHSELSEALEDHRDGRKPNEVYYRFPNGSTWSHPTDASGALLKPAGIPSEIADVIIRALHFCGKHGIDIEQAVTEKMRFNASRPHKHNKII